MSNSEVLVPERLINQFIFSLSFIKASVMFLSVFAALFLFGFSAYSVFF